MSPPTYPGVCVEELPSGAHPIEGVSTSTAAFLGMASIGPVSQAVPASTFNDFETTFGGLAESPELAHAVRQFFVNGGTSAWIVRIVEPAALAQLNDGLAALDVVETLN